MGDLRVQRGGSGDPQLLLIHGLGGTSDVWHGWRPLLEERWPGRWLAPDLPGHGGSAPLPAYTFEGLAAALVDAVGPGPTVVFGHSLGGVVGLALAATGTPVSAVVGLGIKVAWTDEELERARGLAERPVAWFDTRDEAAARYLRVAGLTGLPVGDDAIDAGLSEEDGRWRLAMDPAAFAVGRPDMAGLVAGCGAPVVLARGEGDPMNTDEQIGALGVEAVTLPGLGHSAHVEDAAACLALLAPFTRKS
jgi:pimeloyl-ACP methyl ester carboxylesterase